MDRRNAIPDTRGGGHSWRSDAFSYAPGGAVLATLTIIALGAVAVAVVAYDLGGASRRPEAGLMSLGGLVIILFGLGLAWIMWRRPVLLIVGPDGLHLPVAFERPLPWSRIHRIRLTRWRISLFQRLSMLRVDLVQGAQPEYKHRLWLMPRVDAWMARRFGLRVPLQNLDADEDTVLASIERFKPVLRTAA